MKGLKRGSPYLLQQYHPGLSKIPAPVGVPGSDITEIFRQCGEIFFGLGGVQDGASKWTFYCDVTSWMPTSAGIFDNPG